MISVSGLSVVFGERALFDDIGFFISEKECIGLVGKNGAGKSTLLKMMAGEISPQKGSISMPRNTRVGYLPQEFTLVPTTTVLEEALLAYSEINDLQKQSEEVSTALAEREDYHTDEYMNLIELLNEVNDRLHFLEAGNTEENASKILNGLGFTTEELHMPLKSFSGGWQMRVEIAKLLLQNPQVLLLDEPTNHLDIMSIQWLENFLKSYSGAVMLISHDKAFLDHLCTRTIEIANGKIYDYKLPYSRYLIHREEDRAKQLQAYKNQQKYIQDTQILINKFRAKKNKAAFAQTLIRKLEKLELIEVDDTSRSAFKLRFPPAPRSGSVAIKTENLQKSFGDHQVFTNLDMIVPRGEKIALVGKNGVGKTTLTKIICGLEKYEGEFQLGHNVEIGYYAQNQTEELHGDASVFETIDEAAVGPIRTQIRSLLGAFLFSGDDIDKKVKVLSGGEKARLALCKLLLTPVNLLILDEPTNHLDIQSKDVLKQALIQYDGTVLLVSHDRDFLDGLANNIYEVTPTGLKHFFGGIYEFLQEKNADSIAGFEFSTRKENAPEKVKPQPNKLSHEERKASKKELRRLENRIRKHEAEISEIETRLKELDKILAVMDYSDSSKTHDQLKEYAEKKDRLTYLLGDWEESQLKLETLKQTAD